MPGLARRMRRLMTDHSVRFNLRYGRSWHLFQNRHESVVMEEEPHVLEVVRDVALNPVRAGLVPWVGKAGLSIADLGSLCAMNPASVSSTVETARAELHSAKAHGEPANKICKARTFPPVRASPRFPCVHQAGATASLVAVYCGRAE